MRPCIQEFYPCDNCVGGVSFACDAKHTGRLCEQCADGYFSIGGEMCATCPDTHGISVLVQFVAVLAVLGLWYAMAYVVCSDFEQVNLFITFVQVASLVQSFNVKVGRCRLILL